MRAVKHAVEGCFFVLLCLFFRCLPLCVASALGGKLASLIGPRTGAHRIALKNIRAALPDRTDEETRRIAAGMWDNLGRTAAELPHMPGFDFHRYAEIVNGEIMERAGQDGKGSFFFSGHFANWEILPQTAFALGVPTSVIYR